MNNPPPIRSLFEGVSPGNVGNVFNIPPAEAVSYTTNAYGKPVRVLDISGDDAAGGMICVSIQQERVLDNAGEVGAFSAGGLTTDRVAGPLVGIVEFGAGAGISSFEFDIPTPVISPGFVSVDNGLTVFTGDLLPGKRNNGVMLTLPASSLRVFIRNDANAPWLIQNSPAIPLNETLDPAVIRVHATYGRRPEQCVLTRSIPICFANLSVRPGPTDPLESGGNITLMIPTYAKRVFFPRQPMSATLGIIFQSSVYSGGGLAWINNNYTVAAGSEGPLDIDPGTTYMNISNDSIASVRNLIARFELGI